MVPRPGILSWRLGFSLIGFLVSITIIGVVVAVIASSLGQTRTKVRDTRRLLDMRQIQIALELFAAENSLYPRGTAVVLGEERAACLNNEGWGMAKCLKPYLSPVPRESGDGKYEYHQLAGGASYRVTFELETGVGELAAGSHSVSPEGME